MLNTTNPEAAAAPPEHEGCPRAPFERPPAAGVGGEASTHAVPEQHVKVNVKVIDYRLPKTGISAGGVLQHAKKVFDALSSKHSPMIYKFGFTHDPQWRWTNSLYGYIRQPDKWTSMVVLYQTSEPFSPAMLEASLIELYGGRSPECFSFLVWGRHIICNCSVLSGTVAWNNDSHPKPPIPTLSIKRCSPAHPRSSWLPEREVGRRQCPAFINLGRRHVLYICRV